MTALFCVALIGDLSQSCGNCGSYSCPGCWPEFRDDSCYDCQHHVEDYCPIFECYIGEGVGEVNADDCGEFKPCE